MKSIQIMKHGSTGGIEFENAAAVANVSTGNIPVDVKTWSKSHGLFLLIGLTGKRN